MDKSSQQSGTSVSSGPKRERARILRHLHTLHLLRTHAASIVTTVQAMYKGCGTTSESGSDPHVQLFNYTTVS